MVDVSKGNISLFVQPLPKVRDVAVGLSFKLSGDGCAFNRLHTGCTCPSKCHEAGCEATVVAYALYIVVKLKLCGTPLQVKSSKVVDVWPSFNGGSFGINWRVQGTLSAVRKSLGMAVSMLKPGALYSIYSDLMRTLGLPLNRDEFTYAADEVYQNIKKEIMCSVVGKINLPPGAESKAKAEDAIAVVANKWKADAPSGKKSKPSDIVKCDHSGMAMLKVSGWQAAVVREYIGAQSSARGLILQQYDKELFVNVAERRAEGLESKLSDDRNIKLYVDKLKSFDKELGSMYAYIMLAQGHASAADARSLVKANVSAADVQKVIVGAFK